jgi:hypothetical protein
MNIQVLVSIHDLTVKQLHNIYSTSSMNLDKNLKQYEEND